METMRLERLELAFGAEGVTLEATYGVMVEAGGQTYRVREFKTGIDDGRFPEYATTLETVIGETANGLLARVLELEGAQ